LTNVTRPPEPASPPKTTAADVRRWFSGDDDRPHRCSLPAVAEFIGGRCGERYLVTLTDRRKLSPEEFSQNVGWALHKTNKAFFGNRYRRGRTTFLATYAAQERTADDGLHTHLIVGVPDGALDLKAFPPNGNVAEHLVQAWIRQAPVYRRADGQDWRVVYDLDRAFAYLDKTGRAALNLDHVDVENTKFPTTYAVPDRG
jgi:hypothetical protein